MSIFCKHHTLPHTHTYTHNTHVCKHTCTGFSPPLSVAILHYIGPGRRGTGDWCFLDGFIEFRDLMDAYMQHFHAESKCLEIYSDCSYSGKWVIACREFLDEVGVQPCGHSARKTGFLLKVRTSCKSYEIPHTLLYSARGRGNDKNSGLLYVVGEGQQVARGQHVQGVDATRVTCGEQQGAWQSCRLLEDYTWRRKGEGERVFLVRGVDRGRRCWHYLLMREEREEGEEEEEMIEMFHREVATGNVDLSHYGHTLRCGWGQDPPNQVREWLNQKYRATKN